MRGHAVHQIPHNFEWGVMEGNMLVFVITKLLLDRDVIETSEMAGSGRCGLGRVQDVSGC